MKRVSILSMIPIPAVMVVILASTKTRGRYRQPSSGLPCNPNLVFTLFSIIACSRLYHYSLL